MSLNYYKEQIEKQAALGAMAANIGSKALSGAKAFAGMGAGKRMLAGSAVGGILGGLNHNPESGKSRLSSVLGGAASGAAAGSMLSAGNINKATALGKNIGNGIKNNFKGSNPGNQMIDISNFNVR